ncbi:MAG TPA: rhomboid family intramembrane serine protease [Steroidobacteraceae bacterium]|jgi:membrane associated rhomboid family serine protease|nr:rhomboid family intramembrane serine protease [Steroidobacteraceae bacterium]
MLNLLPPATRAIIVANVAVFLLGALFPSPAFGRLALWPLQTPLFAPYQLITYAFVHQGFLHIFFNMFALFMFGRGLEELWGARRFLVYYFASVLAAGLTQLAFTALTGTVYPTVGASGGVFGVLLAFAMIYPHQRILLLFPPIPMPAWVFVTVYGIAELVMGVLGTQEGVAHFAHLGGMFGGALVIAYWRATGQFRRP